MSRDIGRSVLRHDGDHTTTKTASRHARTALSVGVLLNQLFEVFHEAIDFGYRDLEVIAKRGVRFSEAATECHDITPFERSNSRQNPLVLGNHVSRASQQCLARDRTKSLQICLACIT